ncbi:MAG TPA: hypothetical protein VFF81_10325 [Noviherbaspirillum sp.]|nr:hypothetical protein [Noviherbaspirillum sp.]
MATLWRFESSSGHQVLKGPQLRTFFFFSSENSNAELPTLLLSHNLQSQLDADATEAQLPALACKRLTRIAAAKTPLKTRRPVSTPTGLLSSLHTTQASAYADFLSMKKKASSAQAVSPFFNHADN